MADGNYTMEGWEWDTIFTSSLVEQDVAWHYELLDPGPAVPTATDSHTIFQPSTDSSFPSKDFTGSFANPELFLTSRQEGDSDSTPIPGSAVIATNASDGSLDSSGYNHDTPMSSHQLSSETSLINPPTVNTTRKKKRDPRLECPNFLAGRIPCSCPEEDAFEDAEVEALVKKRSKVAARCQVPSCGRDISHLKGYHQRHRVCLECANSPKVILKDQPHRYCQQCGKFHRLSDFDEGKRSCRRKLEKHNRRRRRRPVEEVEEALGAEVPLHGSDIDCSKMQSSPEVLPASAQIHSKHDAMPQGAQAAAAPTKKGSRSQMARIQFKKQGAPTKEERKTEVASIKKSSDALHVQNREGGVVTRESMDPIADDQHASDDSSASVLRFEKEIISSNKSKSDEDLLLNMLMETASEGVEQRRENVKQLHDLKSEAKRTSCSSGSQRKCIEYATPYPSGRMSFKLYDWNPADFPRRLRQQIFEWLANMPVELESYVRSGCIILTFFVTMPQLMWDKVLTDWKGQVQTLILNSGTELLGTGQLMTRMFEKSICLREGKVTNANCKDLLAPFLVDLYPRSLEAGCYTQIYVSGYNFSGSRFLISFGEHYLECSDWESVENYHFTHGTVWKSLGNLEVQKATVFLPDSKRFGLAYAEVESVHGVSNFLPILVADKDVCLEINTFMANCASLAAVDHKFERSHEEIDILTDIGWSLKYMNKAHLVTGPEVREVLLNRLQSLLTFSSEHRCHVLTQRLMQTALTTVITEKIHCIFGGSQVQNAWNISNTSNNLEDIPISRGLPSLTLEGYAPPKLAAQPTFHGHQAVVRPGQTKELQGLSVKQSRSSVARADLEKVDSSSLLSCKDLIAMEVPLPEEGIPGSVDGWRQKSHLGGGSMEERIPILEDGWRQKGCWAQPLKGTTGTSSLCGSNKKFYRILIAAFGIVTVCTGMCFMLQHPHEVAEISMSLRRCLWGSSNGVQHV